MLEGQSTEAVLNHLRSIVDPELGFSIVDLGLIYDVQLRDEGGVTVLMTLTSPTCPHQGHFTQAITQALQGISQRTQVQFTYTPRWSLAKATEAVRAELALRGVGSGVQW